MIKQIGTLITVETASIWIGWYIALTLYLFYKNNLTIRNAFNSAAYFVLHGLIFSLLIYLLEAEGGVQVDQSMYVIAFSVSLLFVMSLFTAWLAHLVVTFGRRPKSRAAKLCRELSERLDPAWQDQT